MGRFTQLWGSAHARALSSAIIVLDNETDTHKHLEMKECVKYLEVYVDADLSWKHHIEHISRKISKCVGVTAKLIHLIPPQTLLSIFQLLLSPYLTYGICAWGQGAKVHTNKLLILQKRVLRLMYFDKPTNHAIHLPANEVSTVKLFVF